MTRAIVVVGVGGQGVLRTARILGAAATAAGGEVRVGEIYGLSQRGGSVESTVRLGAGGTAFIAPGEADLVLGLEPLETERAVPRMSERATVVMDQTRIVPTNITYTGEAYPALDSIVARVTAAAGSVHVVDGTGEAAAAGNPRMLNVVLLGVVAGLGLLPFAPEHLAAAATAAAGNGDIAAEAFARGAALAATVP